MTQMLYKSPGQHDWPQHGGTFEYIVVPEDGIDLAILDGWHMTTGEALAAVGEKMPDLITHEDATENVAHPVVDRATILQPFDLGNVDDESWNILDENVPFDGMELSPRTVTALAKNGITVTKQLRALSEDQLRALKGIGQSAIDDIGSGFDLLNERA